MEISHVYLWWWFTLPTWQPEVVVWFCGSFSFWFWEQIDIWHLAVTKSRCACALRSSFNKKETRLCHPCVAITKKKEQKKRKKKSGAFLIIIFIIVFSTFFSDIQQQEFQRKSMTKRVELIMFGGDRREEKKNLSRATPVCKFRKTKTELKFT